MKTKTIILTWLLVTPFFCLSQTSTKTNKEVKEAVRDFYKNGLSLLLESSNRATYNVYFKDNNFYWEAEVDMRVLEEDLQDSEVQRLIKNSSYEYSYNMTEKFLSFAKKGKDIFSKTDTNYIYINIYYTKSDLSKIKYLYYIEPNDLWEISNYLNKNDFKKILTKRLN